MRVLAALLLILSTLASTPANLSQQENQEKLSANEEQEVRDFATRFAATLEKTRDLTPYLNKPPASDLLYKAVTRDADEFVANDVASTVGKDRLLKFCIALWNIGYLSESYVYGSYQFEKTAVRDLLLEQQYPPHVVRFIKRNSMIRKWRTKNDFSETRVTTVTQFYSLLNTFTEAAILMRAYFRKHPPERTAIYKQNLTYLGPFLKAITVESCTSEQDCAGLPLRTKTITVNLPVVQLSLVRLDGRLQVLLVGLHND